MSDELGPSSWFPNEEVTTELTETTLSPLSVYCDFNDLCVRYGVDEAFSIVGQLKTLLA